MIEDKELGLNIAENPREVLVKNALDNTKKRIRESEFLVELDKVILEYLKTK